MSEFAIEVIFKSSSHFTENFANKIQSQSVESTQEKEKGKY